MNKFLWTIAVLGLIEVGGSLAYLMMGQVPVRKVSGLYTGLFLWGVLITWAIILIQEQK